MSQPFNWTRFWRKFKIYVIFIIAVFAFAIIGMFQNSSMLSTGGVAAEVNRKPISLKSFQQSYERFQARFGGQLGEGPQRQYFENMMRNNVLNQLITLELVSQSADDLGLKPSDYEVSAKILEILKGIPNISEFGGTKREQYEALLRSNRTKAVEFESSLRKELALENFRNLFERSVYSTPSELEMNEELKDIEMNLAFVRFQKSDLVNEGAVKEAEIQDFLNKNSSEVEQYYKENLISEFTNKEQVRASHILVSMNPKDKSSEEKALKAIKAIQTRLKTEKFEDLAKELSEDPGSKSKGGNLGFFAKGIMAPEFEEVAFQQKEGQVSEPVKTQFGYHIIRTDEKKPRMEQPLEEVKEGIARKLIAKSLVDEKLKQLESSLSQEKSLESHIQQYGLKWEETGLFNLAQTRIPKLGEDEEILYKSFEIPKVGGTLNKLVKSEGKHYIVKLKSKMVKASVSNGDDPQTLSLLSQSKNQSNEILGAWLEGQQKAADIKRNEKLFQN